MSICTGQVCHVIHLDGTGHELEGQLGAAGDDAGCRRVLVLVSRQVPPQDQLPSRLSQAGRQRLILCYVTLSAFAWVNLENLLRMGGK